MSSSGFIPEISELDGRPYIEPAEREAWFHSIHPGWRAVPGDIQIVPVGKGALVSVTAHLYDTGGERMTSRAVSGFFTPEAEEESFGQTIVLSLFSMAKEELYYSMGFTEEFAQVLRSQEPPESEARRGADDRKSPEPVAEKDAAEEDRLRKMCYLLFSAVKSKGYLSKCPDFESWMTSFQGGDRTKWDYLKANAKLGEFAAKKEGGG